MNPELLVFHEQIVACSRAEDLFGTLDGDQSAALKVLYRRFAKIAHADRYKRLDEQRIAHLAFTKLNDFHQQALDKIKFGTYGTSTSILKKNTTPSIIKSKRGTYVISRGMANGDVSTVYAGEFEDKTSVTVKISKHHTANDFLHVEAAILATLNKSAENTVSYKQFVPTLFDTFTVKMAPTNDLRQVNVFRAVEGFHSLTNVVSQYPEGLDPRHFVWIFNRLLTTLSFAHSHGIVHGAILPNHILIHPVTHAIHVVDWCFTRTKGQKLLAMSTNYKSWYPEEVFHAVSSATDIYMAAMCMCYILGADLGEGLEKLPIHPKFRRFLLSCLLRNAARRPQSAWELYKDFGKIAEEVFGPRKYVKLVMA